MCAICGFRILEQLFLYAPIFILVPLAVENQPRNASSLPMAKMISLVLEGKGKEGPDSAITNMSFTQLRDEALAHNPLDLNHVKRVNEAEAEYWKEMSSSGSRLGDSTDILGFDCGGEQWVYEVCIPMGPLSAPISSTEQSRDIQFMHRLMKHIEESGIPAPPPIEQRWTARSTAPMSPAYSADPNDVFTWVGIIMYLPSDPLKRKEVTDAFNRYSSSIDYLVDEFGGVAHWAKIEAPAKNIDYDDNLTRVRARLSKRYPLQQFNDYRSTLDPNNILANNAIEVLIAKK